MRERDAILGLQRARRTAHRAARLRAGDASDDAAAGDGRPVARARRTSSGAASISTRRGGVLYAGERGARAMRFGAIVRAMALGDRRGLSDLERRALTKAPIARAASPSRTWSARSSSIACATRWSCMRAGAQTVPMSLRHAAPGTSDPAGATLGAAWKVENAPITESTRARPRHVHGAQAADVDQADSNELIEDTTNIDRDHRDARWRRRWRSKLDRAALR